MKTSKKYTREMRRQLGYFATWLPGTPLDLGDIGVFKNNIFTKISNLSDFNISFEIEEDANTSDIEHHSAGSVSLSTKASGKTIEGSTLGELDMGIAVQFSRQNAILFKANNAKSPSIKNQIDLGRTIVQLFKDGKWDKNWSVITELVVSESTSVIISSSSKGKIDLKATGDVSINKIDIASAEATFELAYSKDLSTKIIAQQGMTPLFKVSKIKSRLFMPPVFALNKIKAIDITTPLQAKENDDLVYFDDAKLEDIENA